MYTIEAAATATVPSKELISRLKDVFKAYSPTAAQGLAAMCYLAANILPELMWGAGDTVPDPRRGLRIEVKSGGLPIGAGLGSSASFSVAAAGALLRLRQLMFGDLLGKSADVTLDDLNGNESSDGWCPPLHVLHMINEWAFGMRSNDF